MDKPAILAEIQRYLNAVDEKDAWTRDKAHDLFTWLPLVHKVKRFHGEYYSEHTLEPAWLMRDACTLIAYLLGHEDIEINQDMDLDRPFDCPCGELHVPGEDEDHKHWDDLSKGDALRMIERYRKIHEFSKQNL